MEPDDSNSLVNEVFAVAWEVASRESEVDHAFWAHVRLLAEQCRTDADWQGLLGVLLQISLSERPPPLDREPIYRWSVDQHARQGLHASRPRRRRADRGASDAAAARRTNMHADRKGGRLRLRRLLDGEAEAHEAFLREYEGHLEDARVVSEQEKAQVLTRQEHLRTVHGLGHAQRMRLGGTTNDWDAATLGGASSLHDGMDGSRSMEQISSLPLS